jgi:hypothetical protein
VSDETRNLTDADVQAVAAALRQPAPPAAVAPAQPAAPVAVEPQPNAFAVGTLVSHAFHDDYASADVTKDGIVVETVADPGDGTGPKVVIAWLGDRSGNIPESEISAV